MTHCIGFSNLSYDIVVSPNVVADIENSSKVLRELIEREQDEGLGSQVEENRISEVELPRRNMDEHVAYDASKGL